MSLQLIMEDITRIASTLFVIFILWMVAAEVARNFGKHIPGPMDAIRSIRRGKGGI